MNILAGLGHGWHNVHDANGLMITVIGMLLVFSSLLVISLMIRWTPYVLKVVARYFPEEDLALNGNVKSVSETEVVAAISAAICYSMQSTEQQ
ncbi:MAG TPA: OadG family protein [Spirochaetota bacterium]|nr:OadG family protein [Spirochaetota bacterium]